MYNANLLNVRDSGYNYFHSDCRAPTRAKWRNLLKEVKAALVELTIFILRLNRAVQCTELFILNCNFCTVVKRTFTLQVIEF